MVSEFCGFGYISYGLCNLEDKAKSTTHSF